MKKYIFYCICIALLWGCVKKPEEETRVQKQAQPWVFLDFEEEHFPGGVWEENMNDGVTTFKIKRTHLVKHGDKGYSLAIDYNFNLRKDTVGGVWIDVSKLNFSKYSYFGFWVKGEPDLGFTSVIGITFEDNKGNRITRMYGRVSSEWQKVETFLGKLQGIDISHLGEINIVIEKRFANVPSGRIYIDDFYLR